MKPYALLIAAALLVPSVSVASAKEVNRRSIPDHRAAVVTNLVYLEQFSNGVVTFRLNLTGATVAPVVQCLLSPRQYKVFEEAQHSPRLEVYNVDLANLPHNCRRTGGTQI